MSSFLGDIPKSVFDRSFDTANPISSGYAFLNAAASRLILSVFFGLTKLYPRHFGMKSKAY